MATNENKTKELLESTSLPIADFIASIGEGMGSAQRDLDEGSAALFHEIYSAQGEEGLEALRQMGYQPNWYQIPEMKAKLRVALSISSKTKTTRSSRSKLYAHSVNAGYSNQFEYTAGSSSEIEFKVVPVPPPAGTMIPDLLGLSYEETESRLASLGLEFELVEISEAEARKLKVADQNPAPGSRVTEGGGVELKFSK